MAEKALVQFPETKAGKFRRELRSCRTIHALLVVTWKMLRHIEQTDEAGPKPQLPPAPSCVTAED